jgi:hypothetical protein
VGVCGRVPGPIQSPRKATRPSVRLRRRSADDEKFHLEYGPPGPVSCVICPSTCRTKARISRSPSRSRRRSQPHSSSSRRFKARTGVANITGMAGRELRSTALSAGSAWVDVGVRQYGTGHGQAERECGSNHQGASSGKRRSLVGPWINTNPKSTAFQGRSRACLDPSFIQKNAAPFRLDGISSFLLCIRACFAAVVQPGPNDPGDKHGTRHLRPRRQAAVLDRPHGTQQLGRRWSRRPPG